MQRIIELHLANWRNFIKVDISLERRAFIIGPNASGKSNLLDAVRFLADVVAVGGGFREAVLRRGGVSRIRCLAARRYPGITIRVVIGDDDDTSPRWIYELSFTQNNQRQPIITSEIVMHGDGLILSRPDQNDKHDSDRLSQTYLEQVNANQAFRDIADFFRSIRYLHLVPQLVREPDRSVGRHADPYGGDFLEQLTRAPKKILDARLRRIQDALRVAVPQLTELELWRDDRGVPHLRGRYEHWRPKAGWLDEQQLSDGTLRLLGLLWVLLDGSGPLLLEEPELSLHPDIVRYLPQMFHRAQRRTSRQILVSTHSPELLADEGINFNEVIILTPSIEGTKVESAASFVQIRDLVTGGLSMADATLPYTRPQRASQLALL